MTPTVLSSAPVFIPLIHSIKDSVSADMAWWSESTSKLVHIFYGSIDTLARLIVTHEAEINKPHPGPAKPGEMAWHANPAGTRENASEQRNNAIRFGDWQFFA